MRILYICSVVVVPSVDRVFLGSSACIRQAGRGAGRAHGDARLHRRLQAMAEVIDEHRSGEGQSESPNQSQARSHNGP
eukprot:SAG11_NODE_1309_length_5238_cov_64.494260_5_plen_78_part_00